ncbi:MAG TPA: thioredoxin family protein [Roseomonas sp.]|jgi:thiol-disulfide isomerase/thioredoxin
MTFHPLARSRVLQAMKRSFGAAAIVAAGGIALGLETGLLSQASFAGPVREAAMTDTRPAIIQVQAEAPAPLPRLPVEGTLPSLSGAIEWLNTPPLTAEALRGKVVLVNFWTYSCINCLRTLPYLRAWAERYRDQGLVVIGVHTPEFAFERRTENVRRAAMDLGVGYPVAIDNGFAVWRAFSNRYWPAMYFVDAQGRIRHHQFGEGEYANSERVIRSLLAEAGRGGTAAVTPLDQRGTQAPSNTAEVRSPETYLGYGNATGFASPEGVLRDAPQLYRAASLRPNQWSLSGRWTIGEEHADLVEAGGAISYRFQARDLHLVLGSADGRPLRFQVTIDGAPPGIHHGTDVDADGMGTVNGQRLYQLIRQNGAIQPRSFEIRFLDPGAQAYAFTFG